MLTHESCQCYVTLLPLPVPVHAGIPTSTGTGILALAATPVLREHLSRSGLEYLPVNEKSQTRVFCFPSRSSYCLFHDTGKSRHEQLETGGTRTPRDRDASPADSEPESRWCRKFLDNLNLFKFLSTSPWFAANVSACVSESQGGVRPS